jgi:hypothetical protein
MTIVQNIRQAFSTYMTLDLAMVEGRIITRNGVDCHAECINTTGAVGQITGIRQHAAGNGHIIMMTVAVTHDRIEILPKFGE